MDDDDDDDGSDDDGDDDDDGSDDDGSDDVGNDDVWEGVEDDEDEASLFCLLSSSSCLLCWPVRKASD